MLNSQKMAGTSSPMTVEIDVRRGYAAIALTVIALSIIRLALNILGRPATIKAADDWKWKNILMSWIHAFFIGIWDLSSFVMCPELLGDMFSWVNYYTYYCVAVSTGYFIFDFGDMIINRKVFSWWEATLHHLAVIPVFLHNLTTGQCIAFTIVALLCEVNSFFLHSRKLLQMLEIGYDHKFYRLTTLVNLVTFVIFRGTALVVVTYGLYTIYGRVSDWYAYVLSASMFIMNIMHPVLFWRLLKNDFLRRRRSSTNKSVSHTKLLNVDTQHSNNSKVKDT